VTSRFVLREVAVEIRARIKGRVDDGELTGRMRRSFFNGTVREELVEALGRRSNEFRGNDFSGMDLLDVGFRTGIDLSLQRLPTGEQYVYLPEAERTLERAREQVIASGRVHLCG
jgi:hypothetical protein